MTKELLFSTERTLNSCLGSKSPLTKITFSTSGRNPPNIAFIASSLSIILLRLKLQIDPQDDTLI